MLFVVWIGVAVSCTLCVNLCRLAAECAALAREGRARRVTTGVGVVPEAICIRFAARVSPG
jgi:hypothetical protein